MDRAIQEFIRTEFNDVTMIIVAHRMQTIMDSDKIVSWNIFCFLFCALITLCIQLVLDAGCLVEFGSPRELLVKEGGYFKSLVDESSDKDELYKAANVH
jgi:ABC-type multidrug transport system fused ATPase/permease subunit